MAMYSLNLKIAFLILASAQLVLGTCSFAQSGGASCNKRGWSEVDKKNINVLTFDCKSPALGPGI